MLPFTILFPEQLHAESHMKTACQDLFLGEPSHVASVRVANSFGRFGYVWILCLDLGFFQRFGPTFQFQQLGGQPLTTKACAPQNFMVEGEDRPAEAWKVPVKPAFLRELCTLVVRTCLLVEQSSQILDQYIFKDANIDR